MLTMIHVVKHANTVHEKRWLRHEIDVHETRWLIYTWQEDQVMTDSKEEYERYEYALHDWQCICIWPKGLLTVYSNHCDHDTGRWGRPTGFVPGLTTEVQAKEPWPTVERLPGHYDWLAYKALTVGWKVPDHWPTVDSYRVIMNNSYK